MAEAREIRARCGRQAARSKGILTARAIGSLHDVHCDRRRLLRSKRFREQFPRLSDPLECNYQPDVLGFYVQADLRRQKPEETLKYLQGIAYFAQRDPNFLMERAYVQAACGQSRTALVGYSKLLTASSAGAEALPRRHFTEYLRCALKEDRRVWAENALAARLRDEDFPEWRT